MRWAALFSVILWLAYTSALDSADNDPSPKDANRRDARRRKTGG